MAASRQYEDSVLGYTTQKDMYMPMLWESDGADRIGMQNITPQQDYSWATMQVYHGQQLEDISTTATSQAASRTIVAQDSVDLLTPTKWHGECWQRHSELEVEQMKVMEIVHRELSVRQFHYPANLFEGLLRIDGMSSYDIDLWRLWVRELG